MARYYVTHSCGHKSEVHLLGKMKDRQWRLEQMEGELCPECEEKAAAKRKEKKKAKVTAWLSGLGIDEPVALLGTEKQVKWANDIRLWFLYDCFCFYDEPYASEGYPREYIEKEKVIVFEYLTKKVEAATFWIDHRELGGHQLIAELREALREPLSQALENVKSAQIIKEITTVYKTCEECGEPIPLERGRKYCSICAPIVKKRSKERGRYLWVKNNGGATIGKTTKVCTICGETFVVRGSRQKYCSKCRPKVQILKKCALCGCDLPPYRQKHCKECAALYTRYKNYALKRKKRWPLEPPISFQTWLDAHRACRSHGEKQCLDCGATINILGGRKYCEACAKTRKRYSVYKTMHQKNDDGTPLMSFEEWKGIEK